MSLPNINRLPFNGGQSEKVGLKPTRLKGFDF